MRAGERWQETKEPVTTFSRADVTALLDKLEKLLKQHDMDRKLSAHRRMLSPHLLTFCGLCHPLWNVTSTRIPIVVF